MNSEINRIDNETIKKYIINLFKDEIKIKLKLVCNWTTTNELTKYWSKMLCPQKNLELTTGEDFDYMVVINGIHPGIVVDKSKTIMIHMEPNLNEVEDGYFGTLIHKNNVNVAEWNVDLMWNDLLSKDLSNKQDKLSTILSAKYFDPGHIKRIDFVKHIENTIDIDVYGDNKWGYKNYKGSLPYHKKDDALFTYKYTFNVENNQKPNYVTEKLYDAILSETLCFYSGCPNIKEIIDPRAYVYLDLVDFDKDMATISDAIKNDLWKERLPYIKEAKKKIMEELSVFAQIEKLIY